MNHKNQRLQGHNHKSGYNVTIYEGTGDAGESYIRQRSHKRITDTRLIDTSHKDTSRANPGHKDRDNKHIERRSQSHRRQMT